MEIAKRFSSIDICKGLLIILVVMVHVPLALDRVGLDYPYVRFLTNSTCYFYTGFFMPAFFLVSGYASNFNKPVRQFLMSNVKGLLMPLLSLGVLSKMVEFAAFGDSFWTITTGGINYFFLVETLWFLSAMFVARILYLGVYHTFRKDYMRGLAMLLLLVVGVALNHLHPEVQDPSHYHNFFHYRNAMCLSIFLWMGSVARHHGISRKAVYCLGIAYLPFWGLSWLLPVFRPVPYTDSTTLMLLQIPQFLLFAVMGTAFMMMIACMFKKNRILEFLGKNTLVIYGAHFLLLRCCVGVTYSWVDANSKWESVIYYFFLLFATLLLSSALSLFFNRKPASVFIGKF